MSVCENYINLIKGFDNYSPKKLNEILKKYNYSLNSKCSIDLSRHYDFLESENNFDAKFMLRLKDEYGMDNAYFENQDREWRKLSYI